MTAATPAHFLRDRLELTAAEWSAVERTGFVSAERRGKTCMVHKLRFRLTGRQRVRYLGVDDELIAQVRQHLEPFQRRRRSLRQLRRLAEQARAVLRIIKPELASDLAREGYHLHGLAPRRVRPQTSKRRSSLKQ